ncbi:MAG: hypothetical protein ACK2T3_06180 [Candidatus Promineifilaceae bacterium]
MPISVPAQGINGELYSSGGQYLLAIDPQKDEITLRFALVTLGSEECILPELVLDDWGVEHKGLQFYRWIYENGYRFPRAEIFGFDTHGRALQLFLREIDLTARYTCFAYKDPKSSLPEGSELTKFIILDVNTAEAQRVRCPVDIEWPLQNADAEWWQAPPDYMEELAGSLFSG